MTRHTNIDLRSDAGDDADGLTDEAVLHYRKLAEQEKKKSRGTGGPLPHEVSFTGAAGLGIAAVAFDDTQLHADVAGTHDRVDDPWGSDDDEYAVPAAVTRADDEDRDRRRRQGGMALRGSGTRGGSKGGSASMAPAPMMGGAPAAGAGGVGGITPAAPAVGVQAAPQLGMVHNSAAGSMPVGLLQNAQNSSRAATSAAYAPPMGSGGLQAAGSGPGVYDPEFLREALRANGFTRDAEAGSGSELVDTDGDGLGDTPRDEVERGGRGGGAGTGPGGGGSIAVLPVGGNGGSNGPGTAPGGGSSGSGTGGSNTTGPQSPSTNPPVTPGVPSGGTGPSSGPGTGGGAGAGSGGSGAGSGAGGGSGAGAGGNGAGSYSGPSAAGGGAGGNGVDFAQDTATYSGTGGTGYAVTTDDLRRDARQWANVADNSTPVAQTIISAPDAARMFGHMKSPMSTYSAAVTTSQERNVQAGEQSMSIADALDQTAGNFDQQEVEAMIASGRING